MKHEVRVQNLNGGVQLTNVNWASFQLHVLHNAKYLRQGKAKMLKRDSRRGRTVVICGMGPSLAEHADEWCGRAVPFDVWGGNRAAVWLQERDYKVNAAVGIGLEPEMLAEWDDLRRGLPMYVATHLHPSVSEALVARDHLLCFFHSHVQNLDNELRLWRKHFPPSIVVGVGLNVVTRSIALAHHMGYERIVVLGADCALRREQYYADGRTFADVYAHDPMLLRADIDGREWLSRPDIASSAVDLVRMMRMKEMAGRLQLIGDTLPNALRDKDDAFLDRLPKLEAGQRLTGFSIFRPYHPESDSVGAGAAVTAPL